MSSHKRSIGAGVVAALLTVPLVALAQETSAPPLPVVEVSGGYMLLRDTAANENLPGGWYFSGGVNKNRWFGVVGEATGAYGRWDRAGAGSPWTTKAQAYSLMGGPRVFYKTGHFAPFAQMLVGAAHTRNTVEYPAELGLERTYRSSDTDFALQPGGGVSIYLSERVGLRLAADHRFILDYFEGDLYSRGEFRVMAGVTFGFGVR